MFITMSSMFISLVDRIMNEVHYKKEIHYIGGSPFIMYRVKMIGFSPPFHQIKVETTSEKVMRI